jgi:hypothetical protein
MIYEIPQQLVRAAGAAMLPRSSAAGCIAWPTGWAVLSPRQPDRDAD